MKLAKSAASILAMAVSTAVIAKGYVGAGVGATRVDLEDSGVSFDGDDTGWKIFGGYRINDYLGLEIAYY
ncbi:MAG: outer membrane beta-barrel protein, partial [Gammaproteobacteria bacterium]